MIAQLFDEHLDTVVGVREPIRADAHRPGHAIGNAMLSGFLGRLFGSRCADILSGYRVFSRRFVKSFPGAVEWLRNRDRADSPCARTETAHAEVVTAFKERPEGSTSKLSTFRDGFRILGMMLRLFSAERPLFVLRPVGQSRWRRLPCSSPFRCSSPTQRPGLCRAFPTGIIATGLMIMAALSFFAGLSSTQSHAAVAKRACWPTSHCPSLRHATTPDSRRRAHRIPANASMQSKQASHAVDAAREDRRRR